MKITKFKSHINYLKFFSIDTFKKVSSGGSSATLSKDEVINIV